MMGFFSDDGYVVNTSTSTSGVINVPTTAIAGDYAVIYSFYEDDGGATLDSTPTGWTKNATNRDNDGGFQHEFRISVFSKKLVAADIGSSINVLKASGTGQQNAIMLTFRAPGTSGFTITAKADANNNDPGSQTLLASAETPPMLVSGCAVQTGVNVTFSTETPAYQTTLTTSDNKMIVGYTIYIPGDTPSDQVVDKGDSGWNGLACSMIMAT